MAKAHHMHTLPTRPPSLKGKAGPVTRYSMHDLTLWLNQHTLKENPNPKILNRTPAQQTNIQIVKYSGPV